jgi:hypothetical protein
MYCLSFMEGTIEMRSFYYHDFINARKMQRMLLIIEINNLLKDDEEKYLQGPIKFEGSTNEELNRILNGMINLNYHADEYLDHVIDIEVNEMIFEDKIEE